MWPYPGRTAHAAMRYAGTASGSAVHRVVDLQHTGEGIAPGPWPCCRDLRVLEPAHGRGCAGHRPRAAGPGGPGRRAIASAGSRPLGRGLRQPVTFGLAGWAGSGPLSGWARKDARCRSRGRSKGRLGGGDAGPLPGHEDAERSRLDGAADRCGQQDGLAVDADGELGVSASTVTSSVVSMVSPGPCPRRRSPITCRALSTGQRPRRGRRHPAGRAGQGRRRHSSHTVRC